MPHNSPLPGKPSVVNIDVAAMPENHRPAATTISEEHFSNCHTKAVTKTNPFAIGGNGYPVAGVHCDVYGFLAAVYKHQGQVIVGTREQLITAIMDHHTKYQDLQYIGGSRSNAEEGINILLNGYRATHQPSRGYNELPLLVEREGIIYPTPAFGISFGDVLPEVQTSTGAK